MESLDANATVTPLRRRWRPRFSLRTLLLLTLLIGSAFTLHQHWEPWSLARTIGEQPKEAYSTWNAPEPATAVFSEDHHIQFDYPLSQAGHTFGPLDYKEYRLSPSGQILVVITKSAGLQLFATKTGQLLHTITGILPHEFLHAQFDRHEQQLAIMRRIGIPPDEGEKDERPCELRLEDITVKKKLWAVPAGPQERDYWHQKDCGAIHFAENSIAVEEADEGLSFWNRATGARIATGKDSGCIEGSCGKTLIVTEHVHPRNAAPNPGGFGPYRVAGIDMRSGKLQWEAALNDCIRICIDAARNRVIVREYEGPLFALDAVTGKEVARTTVPALEGGEVQVAKCGYNMSLVSKTERLYLDLQNPGDPEAGWKSTLVLDLNDLHPVAKLPIQFCPRDDDPDENTCYRFKFTATYAANPFGTEAANELYVWKRNHDEGPWGVLELPELWLTALLSIGLLWSIRNDWRGLKRAA